MSPKSSRKPDFLIIGAQKAGSTWIYDALKNNASVFLPDKVELLYFSKKNYFTPESFSAYLDNFKAARPDQRVGEKTPGYFWASTKTPSPLPISHNPNIPETVFNALGSDLQLIVSLRNPISRAISAYFHHGKRKRIPASVHLREIGSKFGIVDIGLYSKQFEAWNMHYSVNQMLVLEFERHIAREPKIGYEKLCTFLSVQEGTSSSSLLHNKSNQGPRLFKSGRTIRSGIPGLADIDIHDLEFLVNTFEREIENAYLYLGDNSEWMDELKRLKDELGREYLVTSQHALNVGNAEIPIDMNSSEFLGTLNATGLDAAKPSAKKLPAGFTYEAPCKLGTTIVHGSCFVGAFSYFASGHIYNTTIGRYCSIARDVNIGQFNHPLHWLSTNPFQYQRTFRFKTGSLYPFSAEYSNFKVDADLARKALREVYRETTIGNDVWIANSVKIIGGVRIGDGAVIGAGSVVTKDVRPYSIVAGVPAKVIKIRFPEDIISKLLELKWWNWAPWQLSEIDFSDIRQAIKKLEIISDRETHYAPPLWRVENNMLHQLPTQSD